MWRRIGFLVRIVIGTLEVALAFGLIA